MIRRRTDPNIIQLIWDSIKMENMKQVLPITAKISTYLQNELGCSEEEAQTYIKNSVLDGLITETTSTVNKDGNTTLVKVYSIPYGLTHENETKDWYCIECHLAGTVEACSKCNRVFHTECINKPSKVEALIFVNDTSSPPILKDISLFDPEVAFKENGTADPIPLEEINREKRTERQRLCRICKIKRDEDVCPLNKNDLNYLLSFILDRIKSWLPANLKHKMDPQEQEELWPDYELDWRAKQLWFMHLDMNDIQKKVDNSEYTTISDFQGDIISIRHNIAIFHGFESQEYGAAGYMLNDCIHELSELCVCSDCYRHSNEKLVSSWFCLPCKNPHRLVWAKQKGYPHWPAKIIREAESTYDVRFFAGKYERSVLPKTSVKPIETALDKLQIKRTAGFKKAFEELRLHQKLLADEMEVEKLLANSKSKGKKKRKSKSSMDGERSSQSIPTDGTPTSRDIYEFPDGNDSILTSPSRYKRKAPTPNAKKKQKVEPEKKEERLPNSSQSSETRVDQVTSSTEYLPISEEHSDNQMPELDKPFSDLFEKVRRRIDDAKDKDEMMLIFMSTMNKEIERVKAEHQEEMKKVISETKRKQWCYNCQQDAIYHCCWNTAYCSPTCQQLHWQAEHKKVCRRKR